MSAGSGRLGRATLELLVIFAGVTAAFFVEGYRTDLEERQQLSQVTEGLLVELRRQEVRSQEFADSIAARISSWQSADARGQRAIPAWFVIPGAPYPPTSTWDAAIASGVARLYEPQLRQDLGYYFSEFVGIHANYNRRLAFIEQEVMPRARSGPDAFYDDTGALLPRFATEMELLGEFGNDLSESAAWAGRLWRRLEAEAPGGGGD